MRWICLLSLFLLPSCALLVRKPATPVIPKGAFRVNEAVAVDLKPEDAKIEIDLSKQEMRMVTKSGEEAVWTQISTGRSTSPTPTGDFRVLEKLPTKFSNKYGKWVMKDTREVVVWRIWEHQGPQPPGTEYEGYEMKYWLRLTWPGVGIHHGDFRPGELSSKGCIRVPEEPQRVIWEHAERGTPVTISGSTEGFPDAL
ncbi:MAG: L,D-transpeptidase [Verrucomicrobiaceae bacterium]|nr:L,D-transpeptidase [Verrucomicrobiaceae bacterium]